MSTPESTKEHWEAHWSETDTHLDPNRKIIETIISLGGPTGWKVLEVGAGRGADSVFLARNGAECHVLDYSPAALDKSREIARSNGVEINLVEGDAYALPFDDNQFDLVFSQGFLEHFHDPAVLLAEQRRVINPGGYLIVDVPQRYCIYTLKKKVAIRRGRWFAGWETEFSARQLEKLVRSCGFKVEGTYAWGMAASYGWTIRNAVHKVRGLAGRTRGIFSRPAGDAGGSMAEPEGASISSSRPLCYLANNIGVVARKS